MNPVDYVILALVIVILGGAAFCIYKAKKNGKKCIGCPDSGSCGGSCASCGCGCGKQTENQN